MTRISHFLASTNSLPTLANEFVWCDSLITSVKLWINLAVEWLTSLQRLQENAVNRMFQLSMDRKCWILLILDMEKRNAYTVQHHRMFIIMSDHEGIATLVVLGVSLLAILLSYSMSTTKSPGKSKQLTMEQASEPLESTATVSTKPNKKLPAGCVCSFCGATAEKGCKLCGQKRPQKQWIWLYQAIIRLNVSREQAIDKSSRCKD